ncbi:hypothetical protein [Streptomyces tendae]
MTTSEDPNPTYADSCPQCLRYDVQPDSGIAEGAAAFVAGYRCPACRHVWTCMWGVVPGRIMPPERGSDRDATAAAHEQAAISRARRHLSKEGP